MILVAGATGMVGGEVCRLLAQAGKPVRALVRATAAAEGVRALEKLGVERVEGDVRDRKSLAAACAGAEAVISTISSMPSRYQAGTNDIASVDRDGVMRLIDAARDAGVKRFVYVSFTIDLPFPLRDAKREVERHLIASGIAYTILRPSYFMEVWLSPMVGFDYANGSVRLFGTGDKPVSFISYRDVARFAVASLENPAAKNATLALGGAEAIAPKRAVELFEKNLGRKITIEKIPEDALAAQQKGATDPMQQSFSGLMRGVAAGDAVDMRELSKRFGIRPTSVADYAREMLAAVHAS